MLIAKIVLGLLTVAVIGLLVRFFALGNQSQKMTPHVGLEAGHLRPCPDKPNCAIMPITVPATIAAPGPQVLERVSLILTTKMNAQIRATAENYLHAEFRSSIFGFVDDMELQWDEGARILNVRSASRVGHSDLGANLRRVNELARLIQELPTQP